MQLLLFSVGKFIGINEIYALSSIVYDAYTYYNHFIIRQIDKRIMYTIDIYGLYWTRGVHDPDPL